MGWCEHCEVKFVPSVASRQLSKSKYISAPRLLQRRVQQFPRFHSHHQNAATHPSAAGERGEPLPPGFLRPLSPSPSSQHALHFLSPQPPPRKILNKRPRARRLTPHDPRARPREVLLAASVEGGIARPLPTPRGSVTHPLAPASSAPTGPASPRENIPKKGRKEISA